MSESGAIDLTTAFFEALDRRNGAALAGLLAEEAIHDTGHGKRVVGRAAVRDELIGRAVSLEESHGDIVTMVSPDGRRAAAEATLRGRHSQALEGLPDPTGRRYSVPAGYFFEIEEGRLLRVSRLFDQQALAEHLGED